MTASIPLFDCRLDESARAVIDPVLASGALATGPFVAELETRLAAELGGGIAVALSDMTQALAMALRLSDIGPGDEVLTLAVNCMSSNSAIALVGATPVWVDLDPATLTVNLEDCARALTSRTRALIVYHIAGYPADVVGIESFCCAHGLTYIEDANNALGARSGAYAIGTGGRFGVLSFYANRQVNAIEGAALICADPTDAARARRLRRFGIDSASFRDADGEIAVGVDVAEIGFSASMTNVNACLACHGLDTLRTRLTANTANACTLRTALADLSGIVPIAWAPADNPAFWVFFVRSSDRDGLMRHLKECGVQCSKLHQRNDRYHGFAATSRALPGTDRFEREMLALPVGWWLGPAELSEIVHALTAWAPRKD